MSYQFQRWIITLGAEVHALYRSMPYKSAERLKMELKTYEAELQQLYTYAEQHDIDLIKYYFSFTDIEECLLHIHELLILKHANIK